MKKTKIIDILKKQLISICIVMFVSCTMLTNYAHAGAGGVLLSPIVDFVAFIFDTGLYVVQEMVLGVSGSGQGLWDRADDAMDDTLMHDYDSTVFTPFHTTSAATYTIPDDKMDHGFWGFLSYKFPTIYLSPEEIFAGKVEMLDVDFISSTNDATSRVPTKALHNTIAKWYTTLRNFALAAMLCVLIYTGIRIIISSTAKDSSKYKTLLTNWLVAMCLLFFIHYLILLLVTLSKQITYALYRANSTRDSCRGYWKKWRKCKIRYKSNRICKIHGTI